jgi:hypothetical protein
MSGIPVTPLPDISPFATRSLELSGDKLYPVSSVSHSVFKFMPTIINYLQVNGGSYLVS